MTEQEQIEEMRKTIKQGFQKADCRVPYTNEPYPYFDSQINYIAKSLYDAGYREIDKDSIVLSREELSEEPYNDFCKGCPNVRVRSSGMTDCCADYSCEQFQKYARLLELYKQSRKETAREILNEILFVESVEGWEENEQLVKFSNKIVDKIEELANKYGVEAHDDGTRTD